MQGLATSVCGLDREVAQGPHPGQTKSMRPRSALTVTLAFVLCGVFLSSVPDAAAGAAKTIHHLSQRQARRMVALVARHDGIDLSDTHIELNSMDVGTDFIRGFASFIVIRESSTPGPDETLRRYAVNRRTGDVWEMTLCRHYDFPELESLRGIFGGERKSGGGELAAQSRELGCSGDKKTPTL